MKERIKKLEELLKHEKARNVVLMARVEAAVKVISKMGERCDKLIEDTEKSYDDFSIDIVNIVKSESSLESIMDGGEY